MHQLLTSDVEIFSQIRSAFRFFIGSGMNFEEFFFRSRNIVVRMTKIEGFPNAANRVLFCECIICKKY